MRIVKKSNPHISPTLWLHGAMRKGCITIAYFFFITGINFSFAQIAGGGLHSLALCSDSTVNAWGYNHYGELGIGDTTSKNIPVQVHGTGNVGILTGIASLATGGNPLEGVSHSLALKYDGTVWAWGYNHYGELGTGDTIGRWAPVQVHGPGNVGFLTGIIAIAGGGYHSFALKNDGTVWTWGRNNHGQLGVGDTIGRSVPMQASNLTGIKAIAGGGWGHCLALKNDSTVWAWGQNFFGQLGLGDTTDRYTPLQVSVLSGIIAIAEGAGHSLVLKKDSTIWAWGYNVFGQLGDSTTIDKHSPVKTKNISGAVAVSGGAAHSCALKKDGTAWTWGFNNLGQLGDSTTTNEYAPVQVKNISGIVAISGGGGHSLALQNNGTLWAWGFNSNGQLGNGTYNGSNVPVQVTGLCTVNGVDGLGVGSWEFEVFPNPSADGNFTVLLNTQYSILNTQIEIYNVLGEKVYSEKITNHKSVIINLEQPNGIYFLSIKTQQGTVNKKLIITTQQY